MNQSTFQRLKDLEEKWVTEGNVIVDKPKPTERDLAKARTLADCAEALNNTLKDITETEKELALFLK